jgi:hypothetical protein
VGAEEKVKKLLLRKKSAPNLIITALTAAIWKPSAISASGFNSAMLRSVHGTIPRMTKVHSTIWPKAGDRTTSGELAGVRNTSTPILFSPSYT